MISFWEWSFAHAKYQIVQVVGRVSPVQGQNKSNISTAQTSQCQLFS